MGFHPVGRRRAISRRPKERDDAVEEPLIPHRRRRRQRRGAVHRAAGEPDKSHHNDVDCPQGTRPNFDPVVSFRTWILRRHGMSGLAGAHGELRNADAAYRHPAHGCGGARPTVASGRGAIARSTGRQDAARQPAPGHDRGCDRRGHRRTLDLVSRAPAAAAGPGRSRCDAARHRRARRRPRRRHPGDARRERRGRRGAGADRQSRKDRQARAGGGGQGRRRRPARQHQCRHARGGDRGAQGGTGAGAGERGPCAEDLRPYQPVGRARQCAAGTARPGDRYLA